LAQGEGGTVKKVRREKGPFHKTRVGVAGRGGAVSSKALSSRWWGELGRVN